MKFFLRIVVTAVALWAATRLVSGITFSGNWIGLGNYREFLGSAEFPHILFNTVVWLTANVRLTSSV